MRVLVTGAAGFVGTRICDALLADGMSVRALVRRTDIPQVDGVEYIPGDVTREADVYRASHGVDAVVHLAARAHVMRDHASDPLAEYRRVNVEGTRNVINAARDAGVRHLVLASSVKAVGEASHGAWNTATPPHPVDPYGVSKLEAEALVRDAATSMTTTIVRLPLVYGPGMRGNMLRLFALVNRGWPIPIGRVSNARSLLFVGNAAAAICRVLTGARVGLTAQEPYFLSDGPAISTERLLHDIARALGKPARTIRIPTRPLTLLAAAVGAGQRVSAAFDRLTGSLVVDEREFQRAFHFTPPFSRADGLAETARWFASR